VLRTGIELLTDRQHARLTAVFAGEAHVEVEATWGIYQRIDTAYRQPDRSAAKIALAKVITSISRGVPDELSELITLGRTLKRRSVDVLAYFDRPGTLGYGPHLDRSAADIFQSAASCMSPREPCTSTGLSKTLLSWAQRSAPGQPTTSPAERPHSTDVDRRPSLGVPQDVPLAE